MSADRPINADVEPADKATPDPPAEPRPERPSAETKSEPKAKAKPAPKPKGQAKPEKPQAKRSRQPIPGALKAIAALVAVAILFIVVAVIGAGGDSGSEPAPGPAPAPAPAESEGGETDAAQSAEQLGYPAFATNNTTRVGGSDPAANAAAVALAVFPSVTPEQRPAAVTLVDEDDWAGAIAASVFMSAPLRAPALVSGTELPEASEEALATLDPQGSEETKGTSLIAIGDVEAPGGEVTRVQAGSPAATAAAIAALRDRLLGSDPDHIVLAPSNRPDFAMPAAAWAARSGDPVLFAAGDELPQPTVRVLKRHPEVPVYVLGPSAAISSEVVRAVGKLGNEVHRVSGEDPVANAIAFARYSDGSFGWNVNDPGHGFVLARDDAPLNAAAAAPLSASGTWGPLLLTDSATDLPGPLREYFLDVKPGYTTNPTRAFYNHVWVVGDQEAIDVNQQAQVNEVAELTKIGGAE
ncbi:MAG TPA: cell wall-binding repeat-containing protein [Solirubrobacterales bacterium]|nr:cell wall-binding repeat-containing protein [Solirubrobacterales bacterium]